MELFYYLHFFIFFFYARNERSAALRNCLFVHWYRSAVEHPVCAFASLKKKSTKKDEGVVKPRSSYKLDSQYCLLLSSIFNGAQR